MKRQRRETDRLTSTLQASLFLATFFALAIYSADSPEIVNLTHRPLATPAQRSDRSHGMLPEIVSALRVGGARPGVTTTGVIPPEVINRLEQIEAPSPLGVGDVAAQPWESSSIDPDAFETALRPLPTVLADAIAANDHAQRIGATPPHVPLADPELPSLPTTSPSRRQPSIASAAAECPPTAEGPQAPIAMEPRLPADEPNELTDVHARSATDDVATIQDLDLTFESDGSQQPLGPSAAVRALLAESTPAATGAPTSARVNRTAALKLYRSNALAARGAYFAAQSELIEVLDLIAAAKDAQEAAPYCTQSLKSGIQALREAADFSRLAGADDAAVAAAAHSTPLGRDGGLTGLTPAQAADLYFRFAQLNLGAAVQGEPAGSMALYALGKLYSRLDKAETGNDPLAHRRAFAYQQAALVARCDNYLAAHELGVLLAESGHYRDAEIVLRQVAQRQTSPVVLRNLAMVNHQLGEVDLAVRLEQQAGRFAVEGDVQGAVRWVTPAEFSAAGQSTAGEFYAAQAPAAAAAPTIEDEAQQTAQRKPPNIRSLDPGI